MPPFRPAFPLAPAALALAVLAAPAWAAEDPPQGNPGAPSNPGQGPGGGAPVPAPAPAVSIGELPDQMEAAATAALNAFEQDLDPPAAPRAGAGHAGPAAEPLPAVETKHQAVQVQAPLPTTGPSLWAYPFGPGEGARSRDELKELGPVCWDRDALLAFHPGSGCILRLGLDGRVRVAAEVPCPSGDPMPPGGGSRRLGAMVALGDGTLAVTDPGYHRILALDGEGKLESRFGYMGDAPEPERTWLLLALGPDGQLHGSDGLKIFRIDGYEDAVTVVPTALRLRNPPEPVEAAVQARVRGVTALVRGPGGGLVVVDRLGWVRFLEPGRGGSVLGEWVRKAAFEARGGNRRELDHAAGYLARCAGKPDPGDSRVPWLDDVAKAGFQLGGNRLPPELGAQVLECLMDVPGRAARAAIALDAMARLVRGAGETAGTDAKEPGGAPAP